MHPGGAGGGSVHQLLLAETIYMYVCESEPIVDSCERVAVACRGPAAVRCSAGCRRAVSGSPGRLRTGFSRGDDARRTMGRRVRVLGQTVEKKDSRELVDHDVVSGLKLNIKKYLSLVFFPSSSGFADAPHPSDRPSCRSLASTPFLRGCSPPSVYCDSLAPRLLRPSPRCHCGSCSTVCRCHAPCFQ